MYLGKMVELADSNELYANPQHPYTKALLSSIPIPDPDESDKKNRMVLEGETPSPIDPPPGCRFKQRCKYAMPVCAERDPIFKDLGNKHFVACHLFDK